MTKGNGRIERIIGITLLGSGAAYLAYNKFVTQPALTKEIDQITEMITGANATAKAQTAQANAFSPLYWRGLNLAGTINMSASDAAQSKTDASTLNDNLGTFTFQDDKVIGVFKTFSTQAYVSMVADSFQQAYGNDLLTQLDHMSDTNKSIVLSLVTALPPY